MRQFVIAIVLICCLVLSEAWHHRHSNNGSHKMRRQHWRRNKSPSNKFNHHYHDGPTTKDWPKVNYSSIQFNMLALRCDAITDDSCQNILQCQDKKVGKKFPIGVSGTCYCDCESDMTETTAAPTSPTTTSTTRIVVVD